MMKILIGIVASKRHEHCKDRFLEALKKLGEYDTLVASHEKVDYPFETIKTDNVKESREKLAERAKNYDALFLLETNVIVPEHTLKSLSSVNVPIVGGLYFSGMSYMGVKKIVPLVFSFGNEPNTFLPTPLEAVISADVVQAAAVGLGCCLIRKEALSFNMETPLTFGQRRYLFLYCRLQDL